MKDETLVHLALGSNLGNRPELLEQARLALAQLPLAGFRVSPVYESPPLDNMPQPDYLNQVVRGRTMMNAKELLMHCQQIENRLGRVRKERWGARRMDIDLLSFGGESHQSKLLSIPHPELDNRGFVLLPLSVLSPDWVHPCTGDSIQLLWSNWRAEHHEPPPRLFAGTT